MSNEQIVLSKTGRAFCRKCGHYVKSEFHPDPETGLFRTNVWCDCDCYSLYNPDGTRKELSEADKVRLRIYGHF